MHTLGLHPMLGLTYFPNFLNHLSDQGMWVSYWYNSGFVLRLCSDSCHRLIPPDLLMELTTNEAVLEIKSPFVLFCLTAFQICYLRESHPTD